MHRYRLLLLPLALAGAVAAGLALAPGRAAVVEPPPDIVAVRLSLDGTQLVLASDYQLTGRKLAGAKREYTVRVRFGLTSNPAPLQAFNGPQGFDSATLEILDSQLQVVRTLTFTEPTLTSFGQTIDSDDPPAVEELVLTSRSLTSG